MNSFLLLFISFTLILFAELGDKTQFLILSFSTKTKIRNIVLGIALGTIASHGLAILFGTYLGNISNQILNYYLNMITSICFFFFGVVGLLKTLRIDSKSNSDSININQNSSISYILLIAFSIFIGEFGDKTFFTSLNLGIQYPNNKVSLLFGCIIGMISSNLISIFIGRILKKKLNYFYVSVLSNFLFIIFGILKFIYIFI